MRRPNCVICAILTGFFVWGCEKKTPATPATPEGATTSMEEHKAQTGTPEGAQTEKPADAATTVERQVQESTVDTTAGTKQETSAAATPIADAAKEATAAQEQLAKEAQSELDKALEAVKNGKLDDAEKLLAGIEGKAGTLPPPLPERIAAARKALDAAKAGNNVKSLLPKN